MKTYRNLFYPSLGDDNMDYSLKTGTVKKSKRPQIKKIIENKEEEKKKLRHKIVNKELKLLVHKANRIADKTSGKIRVILEPYFTSEHPEQWLHHIVINALKPILTKGMYDFTFGSIPKRGLSYGKKYVQRYIKNHPKEIKYGLQIDIRHFYQSIDPELLKQRFAKIIKDEQFLYLINYILDSNTGRFPDGEIIKEGLPIGFYTSQWFANYFLQPFDHYVKEELGVSFYARNMDDMIFFSPNKRKLQKDFKCIRKYLSGLGLSIKSNYQVFRFDYIDKDGKRKGRPIDFIGNKFYRDKTTIRKKNFKKAKRKVAKVEKVGRVTWYSGTQIVSYVGMFKHTDTHAAYVKYISSKVNIMLCRKLIGYHFKKLNKRSKNYGLQTRRKFSETVAC